MAINIRRSTPALCYEPDCLGSKPIMHDVMGKDGIKVKTVRWWESKLTLPFLSELEYLLELQTKKK